MLSDVVRSDDVGSDIVRSDVVGSDVVGSDVMRSDVAIENRLNNDSYMMTRRHEQFKIQNSKFKISKSKV